jgi:hypothetical protein
VTLGNEPASGSNLGYRGGSGYMAVPNGPLPELAFAEHYFSTSAEKRALPGTGNCKSREVSTARALTVGLSMMQMALVRPHIQARAVPTGAHLSSAGKAGQPAYPRRLDVPWSSSSP